MSRGGKIEGASCPFSKRWTKNATSDDACDGTHENIELQDTDDPDRFTGTCPRTGERFGFYIHPHQIN